MAVAFHPEFEYVALESGGEVYVVAEALAEAASLAAPIGDSERRESVERAAALGLSRAADGRSF